MKISTRGRYGLRAMVDLAAQDGQQNISLKAIAARQGISEYYLEQLFAELKKAGFIKSARGAKGGYYLGKAAEDISVGEILRVLEGGMYPVECLSEEAEGTCGTAGCDKCVTKSVWAKIYNVMNNVIDSISLRDLVEDYEHILGDETDEKNIL